MHEPESPSEAPPPAPPTHPQSLLRENVEAVVVAILLALLIRQYAVEAFVIPTGSMAPTLLGAHWDLVCTNCGKEQAVSSDAHRGQERRNHNAEGRCPSCKRVVKKDLPEDAFTSGRAEGECDWCHAMTPLTRAGGDPAAREGDVLLSATCGSCGITFENRRRGGKWPWGDISRGDRILVDKLSYRVAAPRRFEVAVFKYPERPSENYIKRLIGLPGEEIDLRDGDVYADGKIARKPDALQATLWRPIREARLVEKDGGGPRRAAWRQDGPPGVWEAIDGGAAWRASPRDANTPSWLTYDRDIRDTNHYNGRAGEGSTVGGSRVVGDVRVTARAELDKAATLLARITVSGEAIDLVAPASGETTLHVGGRKVDLLPGMSTKARSQPRVDLARVDREVILRLDGETAARFALPDAEPGDEARSVEVRVGVRGGATVIRDLDLFRDVYYLRKIESYTNDAFPYRVPPDRYFFLGDNSSNSTDGRKWGTVPAGHLIGRAFEVFWPAVPGDFAMRRIR